MLNSTKPITQSRVSLGIFYKWVKVFKNGPSKICGKQPLKKLKEYGLPKQTIPLQTFSKAVFHKFYLVHSWILCPNCRYSWPNTSKKAASNSSFFGYLLECQKLNWSTKSCEEYSTRSLLVQNQQWKHQNIVGDLFKVNKKDTTTLFASLWCLYH